MVVGECDVYDDVLWRMCVGIQSYLSEAACITNDEIWRYCQEGQKYIHELRLRNVKRYDTPKKLIDFSSEASQLTFSNDGNKFVLSGMTRPPRSWCYVEELQ